VSDKDSVRIGSKPSAIRGIQGMHVSNQLHHRGGLPLDFGGMKFKFGEEIEKILGTDQQPSLFRRDFQYFGVNSS